MPTRLRKVKFTRDLLPRVQDFFCGDQQPWETEAAAWIKSPAADSPHDFAVLAVEQAQPKFGCTNWRMEPSLATLRLDQAGGEFHRQTAGVPRFQ